MKKIMFSSVLIIGISVMVNLANASTVYQVTAGDLALSNGVFAPQSSIALLVVDTANDGFQTSLTAASPLTLDSFITLDDKIVARWDLTAGGQDGLLLSAVANVIYGGGVAANREIGLYWFPTLTTASTVVGSGTQYGFYTDQNVIPLDGSDAWKLPTDSGANLNLNFLTLSEGGQNLNSAGRAQFQTAAIPEPSTMLLVGLGLAGAMTLRRRRS